MKTRHVRMEAGGALCFAEAGLGCVECWRNREVQCGASCAAFLEDESMGRRQVVCLALPHPQPIGVLIKSQINKREWVTSAGVPHESIE